MHVACNIFLGEVRTLLELANGSWASEQNVGLGGCIGDWMDNH